MRRRWERVPTLPGFRRMWNQCPILLFLDQEGNSPNFRPQQYMHSDWERSQNKSKSKASIPHNQNTQAFFTKKTMLCNALETANELVQSTNTNVGLLSEKVGELQKVVKRADSAIAAAKALHVNLDEDKGASIAMQNSSKFKSCCEIRNLP